MPEIPEWVTESYITPQVLPNENIAAYVKWDPGMPTPTVRIKAEADIVISRVLNVADEAWKRYDFSSGKFEIAKEELQIPGFVGFEARYVVPPNEEKNINFVLDFQFTTGEPERHVELKTEIIRPILEVQMMTEEIASTRENPFPRPLNFRLALKGRGDMANDSLRPAIKAIGGKGLRIALETEDEPQEVGNLLFVSSRVSKRAKISITGRGLGMIVFSFDYADRIGNRYSTPMVQVVVNVEEKTNVEVPMNQVNKGNEEPILAPIAVA